MFIELAIHYAIRYAIVKTILKYLNVCFPKITMGMAAILS